MLAHAAGDAGRADADHQVDGKECHGRQVSVQTPIPPGAPPLPS